MPNHVTNILTVFGDCEKLQSMFEAIKSDEIGLGSIDFNKIIPMPENIFRGNIRREERDKYGSNNWYDWSIENWGTKWNSYGYDEQTANSFNGHTITFETAWSFPEPVIVALAAKYPELSFEVYWSDEDFGNNVGAKIYYAGKERMHKIPEGGSKEAFEMAAKVHNVSLADEGYVYDESTGTYEWCDSKEGEDN